MNNFQRTKPLFRDKPDYKSIGLARVSTSTQSVDSQVSLLKDAGCCVVFEETISTRYKNSDRPQLQAALAALDEGDEIVITKLDRLGRTQVEVVSLLHKLQQEGKHARTLDGLINTRGLGSFAPVLIGLLTGLSEVERTLICRMRRIKPPTKMRSDLRESKETSLMFVIGTEI